MFSAELAAFAEALGTSPAKQIVLLPSHSAEPQPCEHLWQFSGAPLLNRHFHGIEDLEEVRPARCAALRTQRERIRSGTRSPGGPDGSRNTVAGQIRNEKASTRQRCCSPS